VSGQLDLVLARLLSFPDEGVLAEAPAIAACVEEAPRDVREPLRRFLGAIGSLDLLERQRLYVEAFDFDRRASLHLTSHTHGDRRQRGARLVGIKRQLRAAGLELDGGELPDHLGVLLELRALAPPEGAELLAELRPAIELVRGRLHETASPYAAVLDGVCATLPRLTRAERAAAERLAVEGPPGELVGLEPFAPPEVMPVTGALR
jgi:nitrate reductase delta subunit